jgi:hypothetical protein
VGKHDDEHLRRFVRARHRGDAGEARRCWEELVISFHDRMDGLVGLAHRGALNADEHELAVAEALGRFSDRLAHTFEGTTMGELVNATKQLARYAALDVQRRAIRDRERSGGSLDAPAPAEDGEGDRPGRLEADEARRAYEQEMERVEIREFLTWAIPQLKGNRRRAAELFLSGAPTRDIMSELDVSEANAHQLIHRALKDLRNLKEQYDA